MVLDKNTLIRYNDHLPGALPLQKRKGSNMTSKTTKRSSLTVDTVRVTYLTQGVEGIRKLSAFRNHKDPRKALKSAFDSLAEYPQVDRGALGAMIAAMDAAKRRNTGGRGVPAPTAGKKKTFKVQRNKKTGALSINLPIPESCINVAKGDSVMVEFNEGSIVVA